MSDWTASLSFILNGFHTNCTEYYFSANFLTILSEKNLNIQKKLICTCTQYIFTCIKYNVSQISIEHFRRVAMTNFFSAIENVGQIFKFKSGVTPRIKWIRIFLQKCTFTQDVLYNNKVCYGKLFQKYNRCGGVEVEYSPCVREIGVQPKS